MDKTARIRQEIERRMKIYKESNYGISLRYQELEELLSFLDTLSEEPSQSLEEAAEKQVNEALFKWSYDDEDGIEQYVYDSFIAGAEWQKEQMMKDAVEGYVNYYEDSGGILMAEAQVGCPYHNGDKVRILVLKAEEE